MVVRATTDAAFILHVERKVRVCVLKFRLWVAADEFLVYGRTWRLNARTLATQGTHSSETNTHLQSPECGYISGGVEGVRSKVESD